MQENKISRKPAFSKHCDETISCLLRTIYSVLETTPENLIHKIILVDDGSVDEELKMAVNIHVSNVQKLKLIVHERPLGVMMARKRGIEQIVSDFFIVLNGHIEVTPGWLEPIIYRLIQQPNVLLTSHVGEIGRAIFEFILENQYKLFCAFDPITIIEEWLTYSRAFRDTRNGSVEPIEYGTIPGMMTAMRKDFFYKLGGFDTGMEIWGFEHIELSVKVWLCGGRVEMIPCSKIGHLYRNIPRQNMYPDFDYKKKNKLRFILVWMDGENKELALEALHRGNYSNQTDPGDLTDRFKIKILNNCKPYQHYIDQLRKMSNPFIPKNVRKSGNIFNNATNQCLEITSIDGIFELITSHCGDQVSQFCVLNDNMNIRISSHWFKLDRRKKKQAQYLLVPELKWKFDESNVFFY